MFVCKSCQPHVCCALAWQAGLKEALSAGSPYNAPWWETMPAVHPFTVFMQQLQVNLPGLYSDSSGMRAGSHAVHALALLLELRKKLEGSSGCYYSCCIRPDRNAVRGLPATLMRYALLPCCATHCCHYDKAVHSPMGLPHLFCVRNDYFMTSCAAQGCRSCIPLPRRPQASTSLPCPPHAPGCSPAHTATRPMTAHVSPSFRSGPHVLKVSCV